VNKLNFLPEGLVVSDIIFIFAAVFKIKSLQEGRKDDDYITISLSRCGRSGDFCWNSVDAAVLDVV